MAKLLTTFRIFYILNRFLLDVVALSLILDA